MSSSPEPSEIGTVVAGRFELRRVLGEGGMGVVYEALDVERGAPCAVKIVTPRRGDGAKVVARFEREAHIAAKLRGPNVARLLDVGTHRGDSRYIAMELLAGRDLAAELRERGRLDLKAAVDIAIQTAHAMAEAHALGVVHRDLKPANLFLVAGEDADPPVVKVLDFGISRLVDDEENLTTDFGQLGTTVYMSPEQIESASRVDARTDVWSLGVVLYEMLVGRPPFDGEGTGVLVAIVTRAVPPPSSCVDDLPPGLEDVVMRALEKSPDARFQSMEELARALAPWAPAGGRPKRGRSRRAILLAGVAASVALVGVAAVMFDARSVVGLASAPTVAPPSALASGSGAPSARHAASPPRHPPHVSGAPRSTRHP